MICFTTLLIMSQTKTVSACPLTLYSDTDNEINIPLTPEKQTRARVLPLRTWDIKTPPNTLRALFSFSGEVDEFLHWLSIDVADCPWQDDSFIPPPQPTPSPGVLILIYRCSSLLAAPLHPKTNDGPQLCGRARDLLATIRKPQLKRPRRERADGSGTGVARRRPLRVRADEEEWHQRRSTAFSLPL